MPETLREFQARILNYASGKWVFRLSLAVVKLGHFRA